MRQLGLPQDSAGFVRRECPFCRRQFKTRPFPGDGLSVHRYLGKQLPHENRHELNRPAARSVCLYCGKAAAPEAWLTAEQRSFLDRVACEYASELRNAQRGYVAQTLALESSRDLVAVAPAKAPAAMPPEPDDLQILPLLCCGEEAKGAEPWASPVFCPRCGARQGGRAQSPR